MRSLPGFMPFLRRILTLLALLSSSPAARADVETVVDVSGKGLGFTANGKEVTSVQGTRMRRDTTERGKAMSYLYDLEQRTLTVLNHSRREADVYGMAALAAEMRNRTRSDALQLKLLPTGSFKERVGQRCEEFTVAVSVPVKVSGGEILVSLLGTAWLARDARSDTDFSRFWSATAGNDLFLGFPSEARSAPGQVLGIMALYQEAAKVGPVYALSLEFKYEGAAAVAGVMQKTASSFQHVMVSATSDPFPPDRFVIPPGYQVHKK